MSEFGQYIRGLRDQRGWKLREAARELGIAHSRLFDLERGISSKTGLPVTPTRDNLEKLAVGYGVSFESLLAFSMLKGKDKLLEGLSPDEIAALEVYRSLSAARRAFWVSIGVGLRNLPRD